MTIAFFVFVSSHISIFIILIVTSIPYCMYSNINHCDNGNMSSLVPIIPMMPKTQVMPRMTKILTIKIVFDIVYCIWYMGTWCKWKDLIYPCLHACLTEYDSIVTKDKTSEMNHLCQRRDVINAGHSEDIQDDVGDADKKHRSAEEHQSGWTVIDPAQARFPWPFIKNQQKVNQGFN